MFTDASLRRLAEMGVDVYLPRTASPSSAPATAAPSAREAAAAVAVYLLADAPEHPLLPALLRVFSGAGITAAVARVPTAGDLLGARALVVFGAAQARAVGGLLSAAQQDALGWVAAATPAELAGDALAKRALWGELKQLLRQLRG